MKYYIWIKSHSDGPDYEDEIKAKNKKEAIQKFVKRLNQYGGDWDEDMIENDVRGENENI